jgi:phosphodiesterase/alkaline phosphatase D-like protein
LLFAIDRLGGSRGDRSRGDRSRGDRSRGDPDAVNAGKIDRSFQYGDLLDIIMLDMRSYRAANSPLQFFGTVRIRHDTKLMTVALHNLTGKSIYSIDLPVTI